MSRDNDSGVSTYKNTNEEGMPEIRVKQDKMIFLFLLMMVICIGVEVAAPYFIEVFSGNEVVIFFRFWIVDVDPTPVVYPWFGETPGVVGFATGLGVLILTGVSFFITLIHKLNKNLFLEKGAMIPFIIAGFFSLLLIVVLVTPAMDEHEDAMVRLPVSCIVTGACGVITLILANVNRVGPWLRAPISWQEAMKVKTLEAGIFPMLLVLKKLQETKGSLDIMDLTRVFGRFKGTIKAKLDRARLTNLIKGQFLGPVSFNLETINLPFIIDDANVPPAIQASVDAMLSRASAIPRASVPPAANPAATTTTVNPAAPSGGAMFCAKCGASVQGKEFCSNCGKKVE